MVSFAKLNQIGLNEIFCSCNEHLLPDSQSNKKKKGLYFHIGSVGGVMSYCFLFICGFTVGVFCYKLTQSMLS